MTGADAPGAAAVARRLAEAEAHCRARGVRLTALRREVLELLLRKGSAKAYELQDDMRAQRHRVAPTTVYRALEFLIANQLVHRVDSLNTFIACTGEHVDHRPLLLVCSVCAKTAEVVDEQAVESLSQRVRDTDAGFRQSGIEIKGVCGACSAGEGH